jgi:hypothetical protein
LTALSFAPIHWHSLAGEANDKGQESIVPSGPQSTKNVL